jgi:hypothetical protein
VGKSVKAMKDWEATGGDDIPRDVIKLLGEYVLIIIIQLIKNICKTGEWPKYFIEAKMPALMGKPKATKGSGHRKISFIAHAANLGCLEEDQFGFRKGKGSRDGIELLRMIIEGALEIEGELFVCFIDWQQAFDRVN